MTTPWMKRGYRNRTWEKREMPGIDTQDGYHDAQEHGQAGQPQQDQESGLQVRTDCKPVER